LSGKEDNNNTSSSTTTMMEQEKPLETYDEMVQEMEQEILLIQLLRPP
jgi:hypothetical protein